MKSRIMFLQCRLHSLQTLSFAISTTLLRWPAMLSKDPLEHGDHPIFGWCKNGVKCNDLSSVYGDPLELSELLLQKLKEVCDCPSRGLVPPLNLVLGHMLIHIPGVDWLDERRIVV
jgi:hypothetical protein